jgi:hypothetical protein
MVLPLQQQGIGSVNGFVLHIGVLELVVWNGAPNERVGDPVALVSLRQCNMAAQLYGNDRKVGKQAA